MKHPALRRLVALLFVFASVFIVASNATAQDLALTGSEPAAADVALPDPLTHATARDLMSRLSDVEVRALLLRRLDSVAAEQAASNTDTSLSENSGAIAQGLYTPSVIAVQRLPILFSSQMDSFRNFTQKIGPDGLLRLFGFMALAILAGLVVEQLINRFTRNWQT